MTTSAPADLIPRKGFMLVAPPQVAAARVVLSTPGAALLGLRPPQGTIRQPWLWAACSSHLVLGHATLDCVSH